MTNIMEYDDLELFRVWLKFGERTKTLRIINKIEHKLAKELKEYLSGIKREYQEQTNVFIISHQQDILDFWEWRNEKIEDLIKGTQPSVEKSYNITIEKARIPTKKKQRLIPISKKDFCRMYSNPVFLKLENAEELYKERQKFIKQKKDEKIDITNDIYKYDDILFNEHYNNDTQYFPNIELKAKKEGFYII